MFFKRFKNFIIDAKIAKPLIFFRVEKVVAANIISYTDTIKPKKKPQSAMAKRKSKKNQE